MTRTPPICRAMAQAVIKERAKPRRSVYGSVSSRVRELAAHGLDVAEIREVVTGLPGFKASAVDAAIYRMRCREEMPQFAKKRPGRFLIELDQLSARHIAAIADERGVNKAMIARMLLKRAVRAEAQRLGA